ncbi:F-box domain-containing protein [Rutstroemia sp. NJR-2017a WRK4]|nr:F-box domain-containing protein [Rutstroemia sp. NJR-2017a WRK4]
MSSKSRKGKEKAETSSGESAKGRMARGHYNLLMGVGDILWPAKRIPPELFTMIISYLPRSAIQNMRLVNKEFEKKVSEYLFKVVVVPFKPEIYGITPEPSLNQAPPVLGEELLRGAIMLQDKGMRVFQAFEVDKEKLAKPPAKNDHDTITSFWGIYKWPFKKYNRYAQLEGLEQTADETRTMARALRYMTKATELGLSIDGGLGWLSGPDTNSKVIERGEKVVVFGSSRFAPEPQPKSTKCGKAASPFPFPSPRSRYPLGNSPRDGSSRLHFLTRMLREAGYNEELVESSVGILESSVGIALGEQPEEQALTDTPTVGEFSWQDSDHLDLDILSDDNFSASASTTIRGQSAATGAPSYHSDDDMNDNDEELHFPVATKNARSKTDNYPLKPNDLTSAQKEMLLELEWAQRAFMQSYAIAVIDNPSTFVNIQTLTIARLPNRHLPILRRNDFWDSLSGLKSLTLAVIPDWRDVVKLPTSWVQDNRIQPSSAVTCVFQLLHEQIAQRKNITTLHFEWLCGGEYAPGLFSRNQHVLAAPVVSNATEMVNRRQKPGVLLLPYVEKLSLKNCWFSPHIFIEFCHSLKTSSLQSLTLDSVSLSAPVIPGAHPHPATHANHHNNALAHAIMFAQQIPGIPGPAAVAPAVAPQVPAPNNDPPAQPDWLARPRAGSWADSIEKLTPGIRLADLRSSRDMSEAPAPHAQTSFRKLAFKSCGYIRLPLDFDQTALDEPIQQHPVPSTAHIAKRINDLEGIMMKPNDTMLGTVSNHIDDLETSTLENAWGMTVGWGPELAELKQEAQLDGISRAGLGRFDGSIEVATTVTDGGR